MELGAKDTTDEEEYKRNNVDGTIHRIYNPTPDSQAFNSGLDRSKVTEAKKRYQPLYDPIGKSVLNRQYFFRYFRKEVKK